MILDCWAGPGGWSEGLGMLGLRDVGIELDEAACATRYAAGHATWQQDITAITDRQWLALRGHVEGLICSPPCTDFSLAGKQQGRAGMTGWHVDVVPKIVDLTRPEWVACEQVPRALPVWREHAHTLTGWGYSTWAGVLCAADYGVPQTRDRAFLLARRGHPVTPPAPTHCQGGAATMFGDLKPWVTMAEALGWGPNCQLDRRQSGAMVLNCDDVPAPTLTAIAIGKTVWKITGPADSWPQTMPATTVAGDPRITARCHHDDGSQGARPASTEQVRAGDYDGTRPIKLTVREGLILQSVRPDFPVTGNKMKVWEQIGNMVPPLLAAHVVAAVTGMAAPVGSGEVVRV